MKNKILKTVATVAFVFFCIASVATGIIAATAHSVNVSTNISFVTKGVMGSVSGYVSGYAYDSTNGYNTTEVTSNFVSNNVLTSEPTTPTFSANFSNSINNLIPWTIGELAIGLNNNISSKICINLSFSNTGDNTMRVGISNLGSLCGVDNFITQYKVTGSVTVAETTLVPQIYFDVATNQTATFTLSFYIQNPSISFDDLTLSGIQVYLASDNDSNWKTLSLKEVDDTLISETKIFSGVNVTLPTPTKTGYTFNAWYETTSLTGTTFTTLSNFTADTTLYAKWTGITYTITYKDQGDVDFSGTHGSNYPTTHTNGTETTLVDPTKADYDFHGWFTTSDCTGTAVTTLGTTAYTSNITLYAKWMLAAGLYTDGTTTFAKVTVDSEEVDATWENLLDGGYVSVSSGTLTGGSNKTSMSGDLVISKTVTSIGYQAFYNCSGLTSVVIPASVTSIGYQAFYNCSGLKCTLTIPNGVTSIGYMAFYYCSALTGALVIPNSVTSIGSHAFGYCSNLTSLTIGTGVTNIEYNMFYFCSALASITIDAENTLYDSRDNCNAIIQTSTNKLIQGCKNTTIPNSITSIGNQAFDGVGLTSIIIPLSVTSLGEEAFVRCSLTSVTIQGTGSITIGSYAFGYSGTELPGKLAYNSTKLYSLNGGTRTGINGTYT